MSESPEKLREEAVKNFNETLDLIQKGKNEEALESLRKAEKAAQDAKDGAILFLTLKTRGQLLQSLGRLEEALETYIFSLITCEKFHETDPENKLYLDTLHMNLNNIGNLGNIFLRADNFPFAQQCYEIGIEASRKQLEFHPENKFYQMYVGNTLNNLGELLSKMGQPKEAKEKYEEALKTYSPLLKNHPENSEYLSDTAMTLNNLGTLFSEKGQKAEAKENFEKALDILKTLSEKEPENEKLKEEISLTLERLEAL
ncbi:tetratricopeptide repeat protein [Methanosarcina sp. Mfa9]|uniref:tetratricopeptide repeat protein n=1 Tax=Methanosarcina sp. Mfa9 TaxID=3439063 RepID=UPI003F880254